ncbi:hypothetical protein ACIBCT_35635 [Streptosporangium sp. NPDC050855]|uniref:hypothetical protein n=1 Tax=Streptosporangium sp. NPDC050855 TaxID=3366194 RepID=UPI00378DEF6C
MSDSTLAVGVLGTANPKAELIEQAVTEWLDSVLPEDDGHLIIWFPADRTVTTPGVAAVHAWAIAAEELTHAVVSTTPGVRGREIAAAADEQVPATGDVVTDLLTAIVGTDNGTCDPYLLLLWEEGTDGDAMEEIARQACDLGIKVMALSSAGIDDINFDDEDDEPQADAEQESGEEDEPEMPENAPTAEISEPHSPSPVSQDPPNPQDLQDPLPGFEHYAVPAAADEAQTFAPAALDDKIIPRLMADFAESLYRVMDAMVRERVETELLRRDALALLAEKRAEVVAFNTTPGKSRDEENKVTVVKKKDGTYAPVKPGRLPGGAHRVQIPESQARELGLVA